MGDVVARLDSGLEAGAVLDRSDDLHHSVFHRDVEAEPAVIAVGRGHQRLVASLVHIGAVRVEARQHSVDGAADQGLVVDLLDIFGTDPLEHAHELIELAIGVDVDRCERGARRRDDRHRADQGERAEEVVGHRG